MDIDVDNGGTPGAVLASFTNLSSSTQFGDCCGLITLTGINGLTLNAGTNYWMVMGPTSINDNTYDAWNWSNSATGLEEYSLDGGMTWNSNGVVAQGAFDIGWWWRRVARPPSLAPLLLFGMGAVGAGMIRRKLNR